MKLPQESEDNADSTDLRDCSGGKIMKKDYPGIFEPFTVKRTTFKNRVVMTPMGSNYGEPDGQMSFEHINYYRLRARGGTGLIIVENANVDYPTGSNGTSQIRIDHDCFMPRLYKLTEAIHQEGGKAAGNPVLRERDRVRKREPAEAEADDPAEAGGEEPDPV